MTDLETMQNMLKRAKIDFTFEEASEGSGNKYIIVERGYIGFFTYLRFDPDGNLVDMVASE